MATASCCCVKLWFGNLLIEGVVGGFGKYSGIEVSLCLGTRPRGVEGKLRELRGKALELIRDKFLPTTDVLFIGTGGTKEGAEEEEEFAFASSPCEPTPSKV